MEFPDVYLMSHLEMWIARKTGCGPVLGSGGGGRNCFSPFLQSCRSQLTLHSYVGVVEAVVIWQKHMLSEPSAGAGFTLYLINQWVPFISMAERYERGQTALL